MKAKSAFAILELLEKLDEQEARLVLCFIRGMLSDKQEKTQKSA